MPGRAGRIGGLIATLLLAPAGMAWAGSSQGLLSVAAVVPARCAVRLPGSLKLHEVTASLSREPVAMRCTKGTLPLGGAASATAVGPRISRHLIPAATTTAVDPRSLGEPTPRLVVTVNF